MTDTPHTRRPAQVKPLVWNLDHQRVKLDPTMIFGKGYDFDGFEFMRQEAYTPIGNYLIWPDTISSKKFSLYCDSDGLYVQSLSEQEAKAAAQAHHDTLVRSMLVDASDGWQPIETAPKDGTPVDLWFPHLGRCENEWYDNGWLTLGTPTHWMPLPPAPQEGE